MKTIAALLLMCVTAQAAEIGGRSARETGRGQGASDWMGFAASPQGRVFQTGTIYPTEEAARSAARIECERTTARSCTSTISVPSDFDVVAIHCVARGQGTYFGASKLNNEDDSAYGKAQRDGFYPNMCSVKARY